MARIITAVGSTPVRPDASTSTMRSRSARGLSRSASSSALSRWKKVVAEPKKTKPCSGSTANQSDIAPSRSSIACGRSAVEQTSRPGTGAPGGALVMNDAMNSKAASTMPSRKTTSSPGTSGERAAGSSDLTKNSHTKLTTKMVHVMQKEGVVVFLRSSKSFSTRKPAPE